VRHAAPILQLLITRTHLHTEPCCRLKNSICCAQFRRFSHSTRTAIYVLLIGHVTAYSCTHMRLFRSLFYHASFNCTFFLLVIALLSTCYHETACFRSSLITDACNVTYSLGYSTLDTRVALKLPYQRLKSNPVRHCPSRFPLRDERCCCMRMEGKTPVGACPLLSSGCRSACPLSNVRRTALRVMPDETFQRVISERNYVNNTALRARTTRVHERR
jgi:hypothetical protein